MAVWKWLSGRAALAVSLVDALPVLGTGTVLVPWAVICFLQGEGARQWRVLQTPCVCW